MECLLHICFLATAKDAPSCLGDVVLLLFCCHASSCRTCTVAFVVFAHAHVFMSHLAVAGAATLKKQAELFFPPEFADDFPVAMQISEKYGLVYVISKLGLLFVYDLATATAVYRNRISPDPIFLTANSPDTGGFYAINRYELLHDHYSVSV